ncbi:MAG: hypothetical protein PHY16_16780 [Methylobacter sp.]|nr:hypothetical protein [Methylobacter sp.]
MTDAVRLGHDGLPTSFYLLYAHQQGEQRRRSYRGLGPERIKVTDLLNLAAF